MDLACDSVHQYFPSTDLTSIYIYIIQILWDTIYSERMLTLPYFARLTLAHLWLCVSRTSLWDHQRVQCTLRTWTVHPQTWRVRVWDQLGASGKLQHIRGTLPQLLLCRGHMQGRAKHLQVQTRFDRFFWIIVEFEWGFIIWLIWSMVKMSILIGSLSGPYFALRTAKMDRTRTDWRLRSRFMKSNGCTSCIFWKQ